MAKHKLSHHEEVEGGKHSHMHHKKQHDHHLKMAKEHAHHMMKAMKEHHHKKKEK